MLLLWLLRNGSQIHTNRRKSALSGYELTGVDCTKQLIFGLQTATYWEGECDLDNRLFPRYKLYNLRNKNKTFSSVVTFHPRTS